MVLHITDSSSDPLGQSETPSQSQCFGTQKVLSDLHWKSIDSSQGLNIKSPTSVEVSLSLELISVVISLFAVTASRNPISLCCQSSLIILTCSLSLLGVKLFVFSIFRLDFFNNWLR